MVHGGPGALLKRTFGTVAPGSLEQMRRAKGYTSKLQAVVDDVCRAGHGEKTLVIAHRHAGCKLLLRMLAQAIGPDYVRGYPPARTVAEQMDPSLGRLLGMPHDELKLDGACKCALCTFNRRAPVAP